MSKLIDADALIKNMHFRDGINEDGAVYVRLRDVRKSIAEQPEAIVRCKNCIFYASTKGYSFGVCKYFNRDADDTDYCNSGERRTE